MQPPPTKYKTYCQAMASNHPHSKETLDSLQNFEEPNDLMARTFRVQVRLIHGFEVKLHHLLNSNTRCLVYHLSGAFLPMILDMMSACKTVLDINAAVGLGLAMTLN